MLNTSDFKSKNFRAVDVAKDDNGIIFALHGYNIFTRKVQCWCLNELMAYNAKEAVMLEVSLIISGKDTLKNA